MHDTYTILRHFADSWMLLAMTGFFVGCCLWVFRPGSRAIHDDAASAILRDDAPSATSAGCGRDCARCACATSSFGDLK